MGGLAAFLALVEAWTCSGLYIQDDLIPDDEDSRTMKIMTSWNVGMLYRCICLFGIDRDVGNMFL